MAPAVGVWVARYCLLQCKYTGAVFADLGHAFCFLGAAVYDGACLLASEAKEEEVRGRDEETQSRKGIRQKKHARRANKT